MSIFNLDRVFKPISVAVIGATDEKESSGCAVVRNLIRDGYEGRLFPVNPDIDEALGLTCRGGLQEIEEAVDLAVIAAPLDALPRVMEQCALKGVGGAIVLSSGAAMAGAEGVPTDQRVWETAYKAGMRIVGPRSCGLISPGAGLNASTLNHMALPGGLALVSQSRSLLAAILDLSLQEGIGFSHLVSVGDMVDIDFGDLINFLGNDPEVTGIALYVEHLTNVRKFMSAARAVSRVKPIVVLKGTGSSAGDWTTTSHGADWAGQDAVYDAAFRRAGVVRVRTVEELLECPELMARQPRPSGAGLAIITNSRGLGLMAADALVEFGLAPARLREETIDRLKRVLPESWNQENPVDIGDNATAGRTREAADICMNAPEVNGALIIHSPVSSTDPAALAGSVADIQLRKRVPVLTVWMGGKDVQKGREVLKKAGIPTYTSPERAVRSFVTMVGHARNLETLREIPPTLPGDLRFNRALAREIIGEGLKGKRRRLNELDAKGLLAAYGIPVPPIAVARSEEEASREAAAMGYPIVVKIHSHDIVHKSEADCVMLRLRNETEVRQAFRHAVDNALLHAPEAEILGVTVQPMITGEGVELILGGKRDELFGPVILFGMGGPARELLDGVAVALPPLNRLLARRLMEETRVTRLIEGHGRLPAANLVLLEEIMIRLSHLVSDFPEIASLDIDPLLPDGKHFWAVDAGAVIEPSVVQSPMHLVVSSYPAQYERSVSAKDGMPILLRPIKPEDAPMLVDLFNSLSPTSIYFRFFRPIKVLSHEMLARFTQIDYEHDVVLVAVRQGTGSEIMVGVVRLMVIPDTTRGEFAIVVGDPWQGKGVGAALLEHCLNIAAERGIKTVWGMVLPENTTMIALGRKVGFTVRRIPGANEYELDIDLDAWRYESN